MRKLLTVGSTRTPTLAMASPFSWPVLVPSVLRTPAPVNLGVRPSLTSTIIEATIHMDLKARDKLQEAEFFLQCMRDNDSASKEFDYFLNAFIGSCRSIQWVLSSQFNEDQDLKSWLSNQLPTAEEKGLLKATNDLRVRSTKIESVKTGKKAIVSFDPSQLSHLPEEDFNTIKQAFETGDFSKFELRLHHKDEGYSSEKPPQGRVFMPISSTHAFREVDEFPNQDALSIAGKYFCAMKSLVEKAEIKFIEHIENNSNTNQ